MLRALRKGELEELLLKEEVHWRQKARVTWVKEGNCNSKFLRRVVNGRHNRNYIKVLEDEEGALLDNIDKFSEEILHFKKNPCTSPLRKS